MNESMNESRVKYSVLEYAYRVSRAYKCVGIQEVMWRVVVTSALIVRRVTDRCWSYLPMQFMNENIITSLPFCDVASSCCTAFAMLWRTKSGTHLRFVLRHIQLPSS